MPTFGYYLMQHHCYHCGNECNESIQLQEKFFCCEGCKMVFQLLDENGMCKYYDLTDMPGLSAKGIFTSEKYNYLDSIAIQDQLIQFKLADQAHVVFYLPQIHCVSCVWLLENLHKINPGIIHSQTHFEKKEIKIVYNPTKISLKELVQLLAFVGYEPMIHLGGNDWLQKKKVNKKQLFKIGVAGFCFSNIMMLSFPDYLSTSVGDLGSLRPFFVYLNLLLSLPVLFFSATGFFVSAYTGLRQKWLNIDTPIALAILVTFGRSVYEIATHTGGGYLDSMSGIVFFMLVGRWFQDKSYDSFSFDRDYTSFFPLGVTVLKEDKQINKPLSDIEKGEILFIRNNEMIAVDAVLLTEGGLIDYSFVTGENAPIEVTKGAAIYAGGVQKGLAIQVQVLKPVGQSYITELWNSPLLNTDKNVDKSFVHPWSQYFTYVLFSIAIVSGIYWWFVNPHNVMTAITSVLIVACPCSLLLTVTFTYGNVLRYLGKYKMYCKNSAVLEGIEKIDTIVFDKTGTLTNHEDTYLQYEGAEISKHHANIIYSVTRESLHPLSQLITNNFSTQGLDIVKVESIQHIPGKGTIAKCIGEPVFIGSASLLMDHGIHIPNPGAGVFIAIDNEYLGKFTINHIYRKGVKEMISRLKLDGYKIHLLSGDHPTEKNNLVNLLGPDTPMIFEQNPNDKLQYIQNLQSKGQKVMMVGDGLNDAGALKKCEVGIAVSDQTHLFTPASDAILEGGMIQSLDLLLKYAKKGKLIIVIIFMLSIVYNIVGMYFATRAALSPMIAAILMPISSISIVAFSALLSYIYSKSLFKRN
jgi:Cu+-exporting ATPase